MTVYIAADSALTLIDWDEANPGFYVTELSRASEQVVRQQFTKPCVYYVGAYSGCSCGFSYGRYPAPPNPEDELQAKESVARLSQYLADVVARIGSIELFACWDGDQAAEPEYRGDITPDEIGGESFWFEEKQFLVVRPR